jgi:hypothetical protein
MIPPFLYKWLALAFALLALLAWGGLGWYGKRAVELEFAGYKLAQARVVADQLAENQRLSDAQAKAGAAISDAYQKGKADVAKAYQPVLADLQFLRLRLAAAGGLREHPATDPGPVPGPPDPAGGPDATACTGDPGRILDAADRVVADLAACEDTRRQLISLQAWVREVVASPSTGHIP